MEANFSIESFFMRSFFLLFCLLLALPVSAADLPPLTGVAEVVFDGDTLVFESGERVRLLGIQAPEVEHPDSPGMPLAEEAKLALEALALDELLRCNFDSRKRDRYRRLLCHLTREKDGLWLQESLLKDGFVQLYTFPDNRSRIDEMLAAESVAREAKKGLWAHEAYRVKTPEEARDHIGRFQVVEGTVKNAARTKDRDYLNFGDDWRTDFTISIGKKALKLFEKDGIDPLIYKGKKVRVRGWIKSLNGPMIEASHPEQIEVID